MRMNIEIAGVGWKTPVTCASGTFGSGMEYAGLLDIGKLGAVTTKGVSVTPWEGNEPVRVAETPSGMLNAIGLQNPGLDEFIRTDLAFLADIDTKVIVNVCGHSEEEYLEAVSILDAQPRADMLEINISCPNVRQGGIAFGQDPAQAFAITQAVRAKTKKPVIMKLSPNVTDIAEMARAVEAGGADCISMINTLTGMKIDVNRRTFLLSNKPGGLSGPAIHPVAVRMVYQAAQAVSIPIIGMGGIATAEDALEMIMAGASAVAVGTMNFHDPQTMLQVTDGIAAYMERNKVEDIRELIGCVH